MDFAIDAMMTRSAGAVRSTIPGSLWTLLLKEPLDESCAGERDKIRAASEFLDPIIERVAVPRRIADGVRRIAVMLPRLATGRSGRFGRTELMTPALDVLEAELLAAGRGTESVQKMRATLVGSEPRARARAAGPRREVSRERRGAE